jgi:hypothetical protein
MVSTTCDDAWHKENNAWKACRLWVLWSVRHKGDGTREISVRLTTGRRAVRRSAYAGELFFKVAVTAVTVLRGISGLGCVLYGKC